MVLRNDISGLSILKMIFVFQGVGVYVLYTRTRTSCLSFCAGSRFDYRRRANTFCNLFRTSAVRNVSWTERQLLASETTRRADKRMSVEQKTGYTPPRSAPSYHPHSP